MGKDIGRANGSHLWEARAEKVLLNKSQETNKVRALNLSHSQKRKFEAKNFSKVPNLHFVEINACDVSGNFGSNLQELRWLQWRHAPFTYLPPLLNLFNLTTMDLSFSTKLAKLWTESNPALQVCYGDTLLQFGITKQVTVML